MWVEGDRLVLHQDDQGLLRGLPLHARGIGIEIGIGIGIGIGIEVGIGIGIGIEIIGIEADLERPRGGEKEVAH